MKKKTCRSKFYKKHFLIAVYDANDVCVGVFDKVEEAAFFLDCSPWSVGHALRDGCRAAHKYKCYAIDIRPTSNDIFKEEDELFYRLSGGGL